MGNFEDFLKNAREATDRPDADAPSKPERQERFVRLGKSMNDAVANPEKYEEVTPPPVPYTGPRRNYWDDIEPQNRAGSPMRASRKKPKDHGLEEAA